MSRNIIITQGECYHAYNRGVDKRTVFEDPADYDRFIALLYLCNGEIPVQLQKQGKTIQEVAAIPRGKTLVDICAYALIPNHFHLLLHEKSAGGISAFMHGLSTGYTNYFNKKNGRVGSLFQGVFKARHIDTDQYASALLNYIHVNPLDLVDPQWKEYGVTNVDSALGFLKKYPYSSFPDYVGSERIESVILNKEAFPRPPQASQHEKDVRDLLSSSKLSFDLEVEAKL